MLTHALVLRIVLLETALAGTNLEVRAKTVFAFSQPREVSLSGTPDARVEKALKKLGLKYQVDKDGDFKLTYALEGGRSHVVFINSNTHWLGNMEIREVWSVVTIFQSEPPATLSQTLLEKNSSFKIGSYQYKNISVGYCLIFCAQISANASPEELRSVLQGVVRTADETENELGGGDDF